MTTYIPVFWTSVESALLVNLIIIITPSAVWLKKLWSFFTSAVLSGCLLVCYWHSATEFIVPLDIMRCVNEGNNAFYLVPIVFSFDAISLVFGFLTFFLVAVCIAITWCSVTFNASFYLFLLWMLEFALLHTFTSQNLLLFYIFFEITLIPMFLMIILWGSRQRKVHAMYVFFFYTVCGSILLLTGILLLYNFTGTLLLPILNRFSFTGIYGYSLWALFFVGFAVKVPLVPFHTWLPEAHVEAPTGGSIILAGLLLKVGTYGMLRFMIPMLNSSVYNLRPITMTVGLVSIFYASLCALRQTDMKKIIAYSSVAHMGLVIMGLFSMSMNGCVGSIFIMFSHGIVAGALFYSIGILYNRYHSRYVSSYSGMGNFMPIYFTLFFVFILANISFPGTSAFAGELMLLVGIFHVDYVMGVMATFSIIFPTLYSMWMYNRLAFGEVTKKIKGFSDLNKFEILIYLLFVVFMVTPGLKPAWLAINLEHFFFTII